MARSTHSSVSQDFSGESWYEHRAALAFCWCFPIDREELAEMRSLSPEAELIHRGSPLRVFARLVPSHGLAVRIEPTDQRQAKGRPPGELPAQLPARLVGHCPGHHS